MLFAGAESAATAVLRDRVREAGLEGRIVFAGVRRDVSRLMSASEALLFPSQTEGLGMVAVEAQAAGLPVLASSIVPRECVVAPDLVRFKDTAADVGQWADELERVMALPRDPAAANRQVARSPYAISNSAAALEALYAGSVPA
jgi:glycosyltransferase involved in cell wall biosynthesis